jgi:arginine utilization protein RocB
MHQKAFFEKRMKKHSDTIVIPTHYDKKQIGNYEHVTYIAFRSPCFNGCKY